MPQALLLIDVQNDYFPGGAYALADIEAASAKAATLLKHFRDAGLPLIHVRHEFASADAPFFKPGSPGADIHDSVAPRTGEAVITKNAVNAGCHWRAASAKWVHGQPRDSGLAPKLFRGYV